MADFRLEDLGNIVLALGMLALFVFGGAILFAAALKYGPALRDYFFERASNRPLGDMLSAMSTSSGFGGTASGMNQYEPDDSDLVRGQQYQVDNGTNAENVPDKKIFVMPTDMSTGDLIELLSKQKENGKYRYSANKIADLIGGTRADVLAEIGKHRPKPQAPPAAKSIQRPQNGW